MCDRDRIILRAAKALARSPAARCIDPDAAMPWLPFTADTQQVVRKGLIETLQEIEQRELRGFIDSLREIMGPRITEIEDAVRTWRGAPNELPGYVQRLASRMRGDLSTEIAAAASRYTAAMADAGARAALSSLPASIPQVAEMVAFGQANPLAVLAAEASSIRLGVTMTDSMAGRVTEAIQEGIRTGETIQEMADWIADEGFTDARAQMIARTESAYAYTGGRLETWRELGVVEGKQWLLSPDACEFCEAAAQQFGEDAIALDEPFYRRGDTLVGTAGGTMSLSYSNVDGPPLHPNCRCDIIAALDPRLLEE